MFISRYEDYAILEQDRENWGAAAHHWRQAYDVYRKKGYLALADLAYVSALNCDKKREEMNS